MSCGVGCRRSSDLVLLWLWHRLAATALIGPLAWEPPYAMVVGLKTHTRTRARTHTHTQKRSSKLFSGGLFFSFFFLGSCLLHTEVPRLRVQSELQLPAYTTARAMPDLSHACDLHCGLWQCWALNPLSKVRDRICILMDTSWVLNLLSQKWELPGGPYFIKQNLG